MTPYNILNPLKRSSFISDFLSVILPSLRSTLFPYTTLFRSLRHSRTLYFGATAPRKCLSAFALPLFKLASERSEEHTSELQSRLQLVCRLLLEKKNLPPGRRRHRRAAVRVLLPGDDPLQHPQPAEAVQFHFRFFIRHPPLTAIYTLSLHDALPIFATFAYVILWRNGTPKMPFGFCSTTVQVSKR